MTVSATIIATETTFANKAPADNDTIAAGAEADFVGANRAQGSVYTFARTGPAVRSGTSGHSVPAPHIAGIRE